MISFGRAGTAALAATGALLLGGCGYDSYGSVGLGVGYGPGGYYDPYYDDYYGGYGYGYPWGYGYPSYGWYNGFYYPGAGVYVFDRGGRRYRWNDDQRQHWEGRGRDRGVWTRTQRPGGWNGRPPQGQGWQQGQPGQPGGGWNRGGRPGGWSGTPQSGGPGVQSPRGGYSAPAPRSSGGGRGHGVWTQQQ